MTINYCSHFVDWYQTVAYHALMKLYCSQMKLSFQQMQNIHLGIIFLESHFLARQQSGRQLAIAHVQPTVISACNR